MYIGSVFPGGGVGACFCLYDGDFFHLVASSVFAYFLEELDGCGYSVAFGGFAWGGYVYEVGGAEGAGHFGEGSFD